MIPPIFVCLIRNLLETVGQCHEIPPRYIQTVNTFAFAHLADRVACMTLSLP